MRSVLIKISVIVALILIGAIFAIPKNSYYSFITAAKKSGNTDIHLVWVTSVATNHDGERIGLENKIRLKSFVVESADVYKESEIVDPLIDQTYKEWLRSKFANKPLAAPYLRFKDEEGHEAFIYLTCSHCTEDEMKTILFNEVLPQLKQDQVTALRMINNVAK